MNSHRANLAGIRRGTRVTVAVLAIFGTAGGGCVQLELADSTASPLYVPVIGKKYELTQDFIIRSVRVEVGAAPSFAYIFAKPAVYIPQYDPKSRLYDPRRRPGYVTRFVTDLGFLPAGTRFSIIGALTREAPFARMNYLIVIEGVSSQLAGDLPVRLGELRGDELYLTPAANGRAPVPNVQFFRPVAETAR